MRSQLVFPMLLLLFVALCASESAQAQTVQYFPQLADGGGYVTTWYFTGLGDGPASVTINLFNPNGAPLALATNRGTASAFTFSIAAAGQLTLRTNGAPSATQVGWARVTSTQPIGATEVFQAIAGGQVVSQAGVLPSDLTGASTLFVAIGGGRNTGVAIANPIPSSNPITFTLYDANGASIANSKLTLAPMNQTARFINEFPGFQTIGAMEGSLAISGLSRFSVVTLALDGVQLAALPALGGRVTHLASTVTVPAVTDISLAGMPSGVTNGSSSVPLNSPVEAGIALVAGRTIQVSATGTIEIDGPDGSGFITGDFLCPISSNGISYLRGPRHSLIGVFLGPDQPSPPTPPTLDFSAAARDLIRVQPLLKQTFFMGSGQTSQGTAKEFVIPDGATRLFLGELSCSVASNRGSFAVNLTMAPR